MDSSFSGFLYAVAGILIGGLATHFLSIDISGRNDFKQASKEFIAAFQNELTRLKLESTTTYDIINPARIKHSDACFMFRRYLKGCELERFKLAWHKYYVSTPPCPADDEEDQKYADERTAIIERIEELLNFANIK